MTQVAVQNGDRIRMETCTGAKDVDGWMDESTVGCGYVDTAKRAGERRAFPCAPALSWDTYPPTTSANNPPIGQTPR